MHLGLWRSGSSVDLSADESQQPPEGKLRRVLTAHTRRRSRRKHDLNTCVAAVTKEPLRLLHSVPVNFSSGSAGEWVSRRGVFSRRNYGSVELLPQVDSSVPEGRGRLFRVEGSDGVDKHEVLESRFGSPTAPVLENPEIQTRWYFKYFLGKVHHNYVGLDEEKNPFFLSVLNGPQCRAILWRKTGAQRISLPMPNRTLPPKQILSHFPHMERLDKGLKEILSPDIQKDLLLLEEQEGSVNFKFGVLYARPGQHTDDEMLGNESGSPEFEEFLTLLGDKIHLKGWDHYRGGLDVKGDMTGNDSVYTVYEGHEVMFHVSTLLPLSADRQQVERKRHIGNDIVNIVFVDDASQVFTFDPHLVKSQFTHIFAVVARVSQEPWYQLTVFSDNTVPLFGPSLPTPPVFTDPQEFREFLLVKLINGEKAAFNTPTFAQKRERTLDLLIKDMYSELGAETKESTFGRNPLTEMIVEPTRNSRRKEEARQIEFVRFGQALKLETIVKGDAPTSLATTGLYRRAPWEPHCILPALPREVVCGDSWKAQGESLVVATHAGVQLLFTDQLPDHPVAELNDLLTGQRLEDHSTDQHIIIDNVVSVRQINVLEAHGILIFRAEKGRDSKMYVFRLSDFLGPVFTLKTKQDLKEHRLEKTKGCHLYSVSSPEGSHLRVVVAIGRKLLVMQWKHSAAWTAWCPTSDTDTIEGFDYINEFSISEAPSLMTLVDAAAGSEDNLICVGYRHQFDVIVERTGEVLNSHVVDAQRVTLVDAIHLHDYDAQLLLCYNNTCHFHSPQGSSLQPDFHWNVEPNTIVNAFPFLLAFSPDQLEIRLLINGSLVTTLAFPKLSLVASKDDVLFATTAPEIEESPSHSPELDGCHAERPLRLFSIPRRSLCSGPARGPRLQLPPSRRIRTTVHLLTPEPGVCRSCSSSPTSTQVSFAQATNHDKE